MCSGFPKWSCSNKIQNMIRKSLKQFSERIKNLERDGDLTQSDRALRRAAAVGLALHELFGQMDQQPPGARILQLAEGPQ